MPRMVVIAASITGRIRETLASTIAWYLSLPSPIRRSISSRSTMAFLISMPESDRKPSSDMKPKAVSVASKAMATPLIDMGTISQMISG